MVIPDLGTGFSVLLNKQLAWTIYNFVLYGLIIIIKNTIRLICCYINYL